MNRQYEYTFKSAVHYVNTIYGIDSKKTLPAVIDVKVNANGFKIFWFSIDRPFKVITIDLKPFNAVIENGRINIPVGVLCTEQFKTSSYKNADFSFSPETISIPVASGDIKKVPVKINLEVKFSSQFGLSGNIFSTPDSVIVSADSGLLKNILYIETEKKSIANITRTQVIDLGLINPDRKNYFLSEDSVEVTIPADQLTEGNTVVKLTSSDPSFTLVPSEVKVTFKTTVKNFRTITADAFLINAQTEKIINGKARVLISKFPSNAEVVFIDPPYVTCLRKK